MTALRWRRGSRRPHQTPRPRQQRRWRCRRRLVARPASGRAAASPPPPPLPGRHPRGRRGRARRPPPPPPRTGPPPSTRRPPTSSPAAATRPARRFAVAVHTTTLVDTSRPTPSTSAGAGSRTRTLPTTIWYPARGADSGGDLVDAPPASGAGPFSLVVWGHGFNLAGRHYQSFLHTWASAGHVIPAPNFPSSTSDR